MKRCRAQTRLQDVSLSAGRELVCLPRLPSSALIPDLQGRGSQTMVAQACLRKCSGASLLPRCSFTANNKCGGSIPLEVEPLKRYTKNFLDVKH